MSQHLVHFGGTTRPAPFWPLLALFHAHSACTSPATATTGHSVVDLPRRAQRPRTRDREPSQDSDLLFTLLVDVNGEGTRTRHDCTVVSHTVGRQRSLLLPPSSSPGLRRMVKKGEGVINRRRRSRKGTPKVCAALLSPFVSRRGLSTVIQTNVSVSLKPTSLSRFV